ncbi:hypothetical protein [Escherichia albertii]|uniref:hypothetical protein n=1 Tax=Escherichia albertii TaxID=208962 RepID=UPI001F49BDD4|nr:hypothetical protein [Escherichia albertii]
MSLQIAVEKVRWLAAGLLELNGCDADIAQDVAEHMIEAERYGFASHGVTLLPEVSGKYRAWRCNRECPPGMLNK